MSKAISIQNAQCFQLKFTEIEINIAMDKKNHTAIGRERERQRRPKMRLGPERYTRKSGCNFKHMLDVHKYIYRLLNIDTYL